MDTNTATLKKESFRTIPRIVELPNLIEVQLNSYQWFLDEGLRGLLETFSPIEDQTGSTALYLVDYRLGDPAYSVADCRDRDMTYEARIWVTARLVKRATNEVEEAEVYLGDLPLMTPKGTFAINGSERVVVSQLARSPGVYFRDTMDLSGRQLYSAQVIPGEGAWVQIDTDANNIIWVRIGQTKKFPITTLIRSFNSFRPEALARTPRIYDMPTDASELIDQHLGEPLTVPLDAKQLQQGQVPAESVVDPNTGEILAEKNRPLDAEVIAILREQKLTNIQVTVEAGTEIDKNLAARLVASGRKTVTLFKPSTPCSTTNDLLMLFGRPHVVENPTRDAILGRRLLKDVKNPETGEIIALAMNKEDKSYQIIDRDIAKRIETAQVPSVEVLEVNEYVERTLNQDRLHNVHTEREALIDIYRNIRPGDPATVDSGRSLLANVFVDRRRYDLAKVGRYKLNKKLGFRYETDDYPMPYNLRSVTKEDLVMMVRYIVALSDMQQGGDPILRTEDFIRLRNELNWTPDRVDYTGQPNALAIAKNLGDFDHIRTNEITVTTDDIDHLENKRVRSVGELLQNAFRMGMIRMEKVAKERMASLDPTALTPQAVISVKPVSAAVKTFFGSSQLSQFMDQINPLAELTHKRRLSALGPGGLSRQNAKLEVRDVHHSHYGRICPIETPEGPNIGLINYMTSYAKIDEYGFLKTPYFPVVDGIVRSDLKPVLLTADEEDGAYIITADTALNEDGSIRDEQVASRYRQRFPTVSRSKIQFMDISPMQIVSPTTALIPFLENDDASRALMGANMQKQAVPLVVPEAPLVRTGMEVETARDSGAIVQSLVDGVVESVSPHRVIVRDRQGNAHVYALMNMLRSNNATCVTQRAIVHAGDRVRAGQTLADGPSTDSGVLALGRNVLVAFMPWNGYNYEDAILLSQRLVKDDVYTSIHIEKYEHEARDTKLGPEEITRDIPNIGEDALRDLDERGVVRIGAEVSADDILVGKVVPKGQGELTAEEKLVIAIFGKKAEETRDVSLRLPHGEKGKVVDIKVFSRFKFKCSTCGAQLDMSKRPDGNVECSQCGASDMERLPGDELSAGVNQLVRVYVAQKRKIMEGDKMAGRHGNKGVVSKIMPEMDMPYLPDGTPVDIVLNPLGVGARMNIGQIMETHLGFAAKELGVFFECPIFEGASARDITGWIQCATDRIQYRTLVDIVLSELKLDSLEGLPKEDPVESWDAEPYGGGRGVRLDRYTGNAHADAHAVGETYGSLLKRVVQAIMTGPEEDRALMVEHLGLAENASEAEVRERIEGNVSNRTGIDPVSGKAYLRSGQTGEPFDYPVTIGEIYMLKLAHLVEDKIHARSTGPYSLVTQQPLGGKALFGGQRFGEMEVWALEAYGAAFTLQEILTIKSDDVLGRVKTYESIVKGESILDPGVPESFKILVKELQSLSLAVGVESETGEELDLKTDDEELADQDRAGAARRRRQRIMRLQEEFEE